MEKNRSDKQERRLKLSARLLVAVSILLFIIGFTWIAIQPENFRDLKNNIRSWIDQGPSSNSYNAKSLLLLDRTTDEVFISKSETKRYRPASIAKLFVLEYARTLAPLDTQIRVSAEALSHVKEGSSLADLKAGEKYQLQDLFAAMLVPSGNDAAYVVADYCGGLSHPEAKSSSERIRLFMEDLNAHIAHQGLHDTYLVDPSGYDFDAYTTVSDIKEVCDLLLEETWFKDIVSKTRYTATLLDGSTKTWQNTNRFLDPKDQYYNEKVQGIKTGSLGGDYNLVLLYKVYGKEFLLVSIGSQSDNSRYDDLSYLLKTIDESSYLKQAR